MLDLRPYLVKILWSDKETINSTGFFCHPDGYILTCYHVIEPYLKEACKSSKDYKYKIVSTLPKDGYYGPFYIPENHSFINICMKAFRNVGLESEVTGMQGWTDGATILNKGYPTLIIGPGSMDVAHTAGEFIQISELINAVKFYLSLIFEICVE